MRLVVFSVPLIVAVFACDLDVRRSSQNTFNSDGLLSKTVEVHELRQLKPEPFNFNTDVPNLLAAQEGVLYAATTGTKNLFAYDAPKGNVAEAWVKLDDFVGTGVNAATRFDLSAATRTVTKISAIKGGVAVAVSDDSDPLAAAPELGLALFSGMKKKADASLDLGVVYGGGAYGFAVRDLVEVVTANQERLIQALVYILAPHNNHYHFVARINRNNLAAGVEEETPRFPAQALPNTYDPHNSGIFAISAYPDHRVAWAKAEGLLTITKNSLGKADPAFEQQLRADVLDVNHAQQWKASTGVAPTRVSAMALVGKYLVVGFEDDGTKNGGMMFADTTAPQLSFVTNLVVASAKIKKIVVGGLDARLIDDNALYGFKDGQFKLLLDGTKISSKRARVNTGVAANSANPDNGPLTYELFKGGAAGDVPADGTTFFDAAPMADAWYVATSNGLFQVKTSTVTRKFEKD